MARTTPGLYFVKTLNGGPPARLMIYCKGATAYEEGQVLRLSGTSGSGIRAAGSATAVFAVTAAPLAKSGATTTEMPVYVINDNNVFEGRVIATGAPRTRLNDRVTFAQATTHTYRIAATVLQGAATACFRVVGYHPDDASGTATNKRFWVTGIQQTI